MKKKLLLLLLVIVFVFIVYFFKDNIIVFIRGSLNITNKPTEFLESFPKKSYNSNDGQLGLSVLYLVVVDYGKQGDIEYANVSFNLTSNSVGYAKLALVIPDDIIRQHLEKFNYDEVFKVKMLDRYNTDIETYENIGDEAGLEPKVFARYSTIENFKKAYESGSVIKVMAISNLPSNNIDQNCIEKNGPDICFVADLSAFYAPDLAEFWKNGKLSENSLIIPYALYEDN